MENSNDVVNTKPSQFQIFKGKAAMRIQLDKPDRMDQLYKVGCLFMQLAPAKPGKGNTGYDWEKKKISVKIGVNDITSIIHGLRNGQDVSLFHEFNDETKTISFSPNTSKPGGYFLTIIHKGSAGENKINVSLEPAEIASIGIMLQASLPLIHNWN